MGLDGRLLAGNIGEADLRILDPVHLATEGAVVVHAHGAGDIESLAVRELLLAVKPEGVVLRPVLGRREDRTRGAQRLKTRRREEITLRREIRVVIRVVLDSGG